MRDERLFPLFADLDPLPGIGPKTKASIGAAGWRLSYLGCAGSPA